MFEKQTILLKLTGELILPTASGLNVTMVKSIADQIKNLADQYRFSIVIGGGNFFRGAQQVGSGLTAQVSHYVGMLATVMNGLIVQDIFQTAGIKTTVLCALECPEIGIAISPQNIQKAKDRGDCLIFTGGTGNPYFTTDTSAVLRALQIEATALWKATKVDGVYAQDPANYPDAQLLTHVSFNDALKLRLGIMDLSAFGLAQQYGMHIRVFNIFIQDALIRAAHDPLFGSTISDIPPYKGYHYEHSI
jgi:uridylate kinase